MLWQARCTADTVKARILDVPDLPAADAMYHQTCSVNFRTGRQIPAMFLWDEPPTKKKRVGRPQDEDQTEAFLKMAQFLQENDDEQITVNYWIEVMNGFLEESQSIAYSHTHMKARLKEYFGEQIIITEINGKSNVVTLRGTSECDCKNFMISRKMIQTWKKYILQLLSY